MIQELKDLLGNTIGFWDTDKECWVPGIQFAEIPLTPQAADADDANEPEPSPSSFTKDELIDILKGWGVAIPTKASKAQLLVLYSQNVNDIQE